MFDNFLEKVWRFLCLLLLAQSFYLCLNHARQFLTPLLNGKTFIKHLLYLIIANLLGVFHIVEMVRAGGKSIGVEFAEE
jgi:hypothetical protein